RRKLAGCLLILCLSFSVMLAPWAVRNYYVHGELIPIGTGGAVVLWGASEQFFIIVERKKNFSEFLIALRSQGREVPINNKTPKTVDQFFYKAAIENYRLQWAKDPTSLMGFLLKKACRLWYATESGSNHLLILFVNLPLYVLSAFGAVSALREKIKLAWLLVGL